MTAPRTHQKRHGTGCKLAMISAMSFLAELHRHEPTPRDRQKTARFPGGHLQ
jgi:hypothetical protein